MEQLLESFIICFKVVNWDRKEPQFARLLILEESSSPPSLLFFFLILPSQVNFIKWKLLISEIHETALSEAVK